MKTFTDFKDAKFKGIVVIFEFGLSFKIDPFNFSDNFEFLQPQTIVADCLANCLTVSKPIPDVVPVII